MAFPKNWARSKFGFYWLVGILEGEGCFFANKKDHHIRLQLKMCDRDVVSNVAKLLGARRIYTYKEKKKPHWRRNYTVILDGPQAAAWILQLLPYMSKRRKQQMRQALSVYMKREIWAK